MANYLALLYLDARKPSSHYLPAWLERYRESLVAKVPGSNESTDEAGPLSLGPRLRSSKMPDAYRTIIYGKGTWVIHMLHEMLHDPAAKDGDTRFRDLLQAILTKYRFRALTAEDFQREVERQMTPAMDLEGTRRMDWFFDEWVRETGIPHYSVKFEVKPHGNEFLVTGRLEQDEVDDLFTAPVPLYVARPGTRPDRLGIVITTGPATRFHFISHIRPTHLLIDPHLTLLCQTN
jgi:aminopeptidase N